MSGRLTLVVVLIVLGLSGICFAQQGVTIYSPDAAVAGPQRSAHWANCNVPHACPSMVPPPPNHPVFTVYGHHFQAYNSKCQGAAWQSLLHRRAEPVNDPKCAALIQKVLKIAREHDKASPTPTPSPSAANDSK